MLVVMFLTSMRSTPNHYYGHFSVVVSALREPRPTNSALLCHSMILTIMYRSVVHVNIDFQYVAPINFLAFAYYFHCILLMLMFLLQ